MFEIRNRFTRIQIMSKYFYTDPNHVNIFSANPYLRKSRKKKLSKRTQLRYFRAIFKFVCHCHIWIRITPHLGKDGDDKDVDDEADKEGDGCLDKVVHVRLPHLLLLTPAYCTTEYEIPTPAHIQQQNMKSTSCFLFLHTYNNIIWKAPPASYSCTHTVQ